jgi:ubiquinone/menaquinone biosynthesis C-methylase UbiE
MPESQKSRLHLGCGKRYLEGYIHIDIADFPHIQYKQSILDLPQFAKDSVDEIYCCGTLEYFDKFEQDYALREWKRVLKPKGILRLSVPDFAGICAVYQKYGDIKHEGILGPLFGEIEVNGKKLYQKTVFDYNSLWSLLKQHGFKQIEEFNPFKIFPKGYDDYSMSFVPYKKRRGIPISLNLEAIK